MSLQHVPDEYTDTALSAAPEGAADSQPDSVPELAPDRAPIDTQESASEPAPGSPPKKPPRKKSALHALLMLCVKLLVVAVIGWAALTFVFGVFRLAGNNMYPMLKDGDLCVTYRLEEYHSDDVVAYRVNDRIRFGRVIARGGDTVDGDEQGVLVNGLHPSEEIFYPTQILDTGLTLPLTLAEGECLVLNDYREDLNDSRTYGVIDEDDLEGKVIFIFRRRGF